jgi:hypothetical protein
VVHGRSINAAAVLTLALSLSGTLPRALPRLASAAELLAVAGRSGVLLAGALLSTSGLSGMLLSGGWLT